MRTDTSHCPRPPRPQNNGERTPLPGDAAGRWMGWGVGGEDALPPALARREESERGRAAGGRGRAAGLVGGEFGGSAPAPRARGDRTPHPPSPPGPRRLSRSPGVRSRRCSEATARGGRGVRSTSASSGREPRQPSRIPASPRPSLVRRGSGEWRARARAARRGVRSLSPVRGPRWRRCGSEKCGCSRGRSRGSPNRKDSKGCRDGLRGVCGSLG